MRLVAVAGAEWPPQQIRWRVQSPGTISRQWQAKHHVPARPTRVAKPSAVGRQCATRAVSWPAPLEPCEANAEWADAHGNLALHGKGSTQSKYRARTAAVGLERVHASLPIHAQSG